MKFENFNEYDTPIGTIYFEDFDTREVFDGIKLLDSNQKLYELLSLEIDDYTSDVYSNPEIRAKEHYDKLLDRLENIETIDDFLAGFQTFNTLFYTENIEDLYELFGCSTEAEVLEQPETMIIGKYYILEANEDDLLKYVDIEEPLVEVNTGYGTIYVDKFHEGEPIALYDSKKEFVWPLKWQLQIPDQYVWSWLLTQMEKKKSVKELLDWIGFTDNMLVGEHIIGSTSFQLYHKLLFQEIQMSDTLINFIKNRKDNK